MRSIAIALLLALTFGCESQAPQREVRTPPATLIEEEARVRPIPLESESEVDLPRAALGERLFADPQLSSDGTVACTTCHDLEDGGDAGEALSHLPNRTAGPINAPSVFNLAHQFRWSWTGRWTSMSDQIDAAMRAPHAMGIETPEAVERVRASYEADFARVFPGEGLTVDTFHAAMTEYLLALDTPNAPFDLYLRNPNGNPLEPDAAAGWDLFQSYGCVSCHQGMNVGGNMFQRFGVLDDYFASDASSAPPRCPGDAGRELVTHDPADAHVFRVPSLRNVALTAPYFHCGQAPTLEAAIQTMGHYQLGRELTETEVRQLAAFLRSLTGDRPRPIGMRGP